MRAKRGERSVLREARDGHNFLAHINLLALHPRHISERFFLFQQQKFLKKVQ